MTEAIGLGIAAAGLFLSLAIVAFQLGRVSKQVDQNTQDIREIRTNYVAGTREIDAKMGAVLQKLNDVCDRTSRIEEKIKGRPGSEQ